MSKMIESPAYFTGKDLFVELDGGSGNLVRALLKRLVDRGPKFLGDWAKAAGDLMPPWLKFGRPYRKAVALLTESDWWDEKTLISYQEQLLKRLIHQCFENVPYYREVFLEHGLTPKDIETMDDLRKIPLLTKETVKRRKKDFIAANASFFTKERAFTGGSTGDPLDFYIDSHTRAMERAQELRQLRWLGYEAGDIVAELRSETFTDPVAIYRYSPVSKYLRLGPAGEDDESLSLTVKLLQRFKPAFISAYPSALRILTRWLARHKETIPPLKYVVTSSETLYPSIRQQAEEVLKCRVIDHYGQNELVACASQCAEAAGYHIEMEQNIVELVPSREGENEIVGTSLHNLSMPFLRYRTGDLGEMGHEPCPCGRKHPVLASVKGRYGDIIITPEGNLIPVATMTYPFFHVEAIREGQIVQEAIDTLRVKVVPWEDYADETEKLLVDKLNYYLRSPGLKIIVEKVAEIPRTARGKKPFIISHLNVDDYI